MDKKEIKTRILRAVVAYQDSVTFLGPKSVINAMVEALTIILAELYYLFNQVRKKLFLASSSGSDLDEYAAQYGIERDRNLHAATTVVFVPVLTSVVSIDSPGSYVDITVLDGSEFDAADEITIRSGYGDPPDSETQTIASKPSANVIRIGVAALDNSYAAGDLIIMRKTIGAGTRLASATGVVFETMDSVVTGSANPLLTGENPDLALADKVDVRCVESGEIGNVAIHAINRFETDPGGIFSLFNPLPATGGAAKEDDFVLRNRVYTRLAALAQTSEMSLLDLARQANRDVLRALMSPGSDVNEIVLTIFHRQGNAFSSAELANIKEFIGERLKGPLTVTVQNGTFTAVQIIAKVAMLRGYTLNDIFNEAANRYASLIDFRKLEFGTTLDSAELLSLLRDITGVGNVEDFTPSSDLAMADTSLPRFTSLKLTSLDNPGEIVSSDINQAY
jgi:uncharacterized phage protein gp47/JayE